MLNLYLKIQILNYQLWFKFRILIMYIDLEFRILHLEKEIK